jgi:hypothetical protein
MRRQPANVLNKSMSTMWMAHRRTKLNLNSPPVSTPVAEMEDVSVPATTVPLETEPVEVDAPPPTPDVVPTPGKRKARPRADDASTKRAKIGAGKDKDYAPPAARLADVGGAGGAVARSSRSRCSTRRCTCTRASRPRAACSCTGHLGAGRRCLHMLSPGCVAILSLIA